ncbi:aminoglycoside phosphotransferase family protein [Sphaerisporangium sp. TRM90804]|uniref:phosphotransferase enzyme family protein n=1 Tax=Sphaerisporangium sp. TRM90804 TaxID=3031113 RepID=UPI002449DDA6|nr:aminoglycoside phosphotransferase family protein [Sphaerisporangium sp. TRM90804]MDH2429599.1 aminoglycoside phosphotransferase family protein [Sphaerisporangium sp. TRM90804]
MSVTTVDPSGGLTRDNLRSLLAAACAAVGLDAEGAELIKFTNNAVFRLRTAPVVVRVAGSAATRGQAGNVVRVARWLAAHDFPGVRLLPGVTQPLVLRGQIVTLWEDVRPTGRRPDGADLAVLLRRLHALPYPPAVLPAWRPMEDVRQRLAEPEELDPADHAFLLAECDEIDERLAALRFELPPGVIHGDAFCGNLIAGEQGPVLCDYDGTAIGPREWDLTPVAVGRLRLDYPTDDHALMVAAYGVDVTRWDGFPVLRRLRELKLVTSVLPVLRSNPGVRGQWEHRMRTYKARDLTTRWQPYR